MAITRRTDFAVRMMVELAQLPPEATLSAHDIFEATDVPPTFGNPLLTFLTESGMVETVGYQERLFRLASPPQEITMAEIVLACEPEFSLAQCARDPETCTRSSFCGVHTIWRHLDRVVWRQLEAITLEDIVTGSVPLADATPHLPANVMGSVGIA